jgi:TRAP-type mannitol/chloroaromatic compound transport system permease large subunit
MLINLINNIAFLVALVAAGQIVISRFHKNSLNRQIMLGLLFGGVALLGMAAFYRLQLGRVAPRAVRTSDIYWGAIPFVLIQLVMVALVLTVPGLVGKHDETVDSGMVEIQLDNANDAYLRPPEE